MTWRAGCEDQPRCTFFSAALGPHPIVIVSKPRGKPIHPPNTPLPPQIVISDTSAIPPPRPPPWTPPTPAMATAGPFLRYGNCLPGSPTAWTGSALFLTFSGDTTPVKAPAVDDSPTTTLPYAVEAHTGDSPAPVLTLEDRNAPGGAGERLRQISAEPLDSALGWTFWRFNLALELGLHEREIKYSVSVPDGTPTGPVHTFYLPPAGSPAHWAYFSCNGISSDVEEEHWARADPNYLWRDLLGVHSAFPFHILVGGGDQVYADGVWDKCPVLKEWGALEDEDEKIETPWTRDAAAQATQFYFSNYLENFTQPEVAAAFAAIPTVMVWDDHDIFGELKLKKEKNGWSGIKGLTVRFFFLCRRLGVVRRRDAALSCVPRHLFRRPAVLFAVSAAHDGGAGEDAPRVHSAVGSGAGLPLRALRWTARGSDGYRHAH